MLLGLALTASSRALILDEPIFARSAFEWATSGQLVISNLAAPNAVFDTLWGGLFAKFLGNTPSALRFSSLVLTALSAPFMFWLCRQLGASRVMGFVGTAGYLFSPLLFTLSVTFMTDGHALALSLISIAFVVRGFSGENHKLLFLAVGSFFAAIGFLSRPQALIVPVAGLLAVWLTRSDSKPWQAATVLLGPPLLTYALHASWISDVGEPLIRSVSRQGLTGRSITEVGAFAAMGLISGIVYTGLFVTPVLPLVVPRFSVLHRRKPAVLATTALVIPVFFGIVGKPGLDPLLRQAWLSPTGMGAVDRSHLGQRPPIWGPEIHTVIGAVILIGFVGLVVSAAHRWRCLPNGSVGAFVLLYVGGVVAAATISSMAAFDHIPDRYLLPLLPVAIGVSMAFASVSRQRLALAGFLLMGLAAFSIVGTRDALVAHEAALATSEAAVASGIDPLVFEGGAAWSAIQFGTYEKGIAPILDRPGPWWIKFYAVDTEPELGIALERLDGYEILGRVEYQSLLHIDRTFVYLIRRNPEDGYFIDSADF